jgi:hypothetical protein
MSRIIDKINYKIEKSESIIGFFSSEWERFLTIEGKKAYHIGVHCDTCSFFFERLVGANKSSMTPEILSQQLRSGLSSIELSLLNDISKIIPTGKYITSLLEIKPSLVELGTDNDYFVNEQVQVWGIDPFWGLPQYPKVKYYRGETKALSNEEKFFEFVVPMTPQNWMKDETLQVYNSIVNDNKKPTALAISILDVRQPTNWENELEHTKHYCLSHYLIDGHHKIHSASKQGKSITLLSFLAIEESVAYSKEIDFMFSKL